jgi:hypothetical protein
MKIRQSHRQPPFKSLRHISCGSAVTFARTFHQDMQQDDVFIVLNVTGCYHPQECRDGKVGVANLRTGKLSFVCEDRNVLRVDAAVIIE